MRILKCSLIVFLVGFHGMGQDLKTDSLSLKTTDNSKFNYKALLIPTAFIGYGVWTLNNKDLKKLDYSINDKLNPFPHDQFKWDDFFQYVPQASVYALNAFGIRGKHNLVDRTVILATAYSLLYVSVELMKMNIDVRRPTGDSLAAFPSGHTASVFMGAEFLYQEYKDVSVWYGISGYTLATATAFLRMYNKLHWFSDVVAGAGIGILSTKVAYWLHPVFKNIFSKKKKHINGMLMPFYTGKSYGFGMVAKF